MKKVTAILLVFSLVISLATGMGSKEVLAVSGDYTTASELPLNGQWSVEDWITDDNTVDWYRLNVPEDGKLTIKTMVYCDSLRYRLYNADLSNEISSHSWQNGSEASPSTNTYTYVLSAGTYYLQMEQYYNGKYKLYAGFEGYGAGDQAAVSYDSPQDLPINTMLTGALTQTDSTDWYRLSVPSAGSYNVKFTVYMNRATIRLFNADLSKEIGNDKWQDGSELAPDTSSYDYTLSAGTYYIQIEKGYEGKYTLVWSALTPENCTHDYEESYVGSTYVSKGYTVHKCKKCGHSYQDNYQEVKKLGQTSVYGLMKKRKAIVQWYSVTDASGYQLRYGLKKNLKKKGKTITVKGGKKTKKTVKKLKRKKRYYFQVRAYKKVGNKTVYGNWSTVKTGKVL